MDNNSKEFKMAANWIKKLNSKPDDDTLLELYGLYKQATLGDNNTDKPSFIDFKGNKKWNAWNKNKGKNKNKSEIEYITKVNLCIKKYGIKK